MIGTGWLRIRKLGYSLSHSQCWKPLRMGVAPSIEHQKVLDGLDCDLIIDVGANRGQFSLISRMIKPDVPIMAFEPIPDEAAIYRRVTTGLNLIKLHPMALGEKTCEAEIHISQSADSSSLLPIGELQTKMFPLTNEVGTLTVPVKMLDDFRSEWEKYSRILLKIDVQGFELSVLKGAIHTLVNCTYVYVECSETELYVGQALYREVFAFLSERGFGVRSRYNEVLVDGKLIQADYLFARHDIS